MMKVSVIVPCYNQAPFLDEALGSVLAQDYQDWECIIVDDGSTDDTPDIAGTWTRKDPRFLSYTKENGGLPGARNYGIERCSGPYILPLDADDRISPNYLSRCVEALREDGVRLVYGKTVQFGDREGVWDLGNYSYRDLLITNMIHCCAMYRKSDWEGAGGYDERMTEGLEDWEFWIRILNETDRVPLLDDISFYYRIREASMIANMDKSKELEIKSYVFSKHRTTYFKRFTEMAKEIKTSNDRWNSPVMVFRQLVKLVTGMNDRKTK